MNYVHLLCPSNDLNQDELSHIARPKPAAQQLRNATSSRSSCAHLNRARRESGLTAPQFSRPAGLPPTLLWTQSAPSALRRSARTRPGSTCVNESGSEIKRRQTGFYSPESGQYYPWNSPQLIYAIPEQEVLENKNMVQNPGY